MDVNEGADLANLEFDYQFAGKTYKLKKASLRQAIAWQKKVTELANSGAPSDLSGVAYALFLSLSAVDAAITEDYVLDNTAGDIDAFATLKQLGFMSQQKVDLALKIRDSLVKTPNPAPSSGAGSTRP